ncbi:MAG: hypothetical protein K6U12_02415 [Armatimonadetes bacterium]|nr:hypothetical protein [Armatimonadota bacterium]
MQTHYPIRFDSERWSTGSWFGTRGRYRYRLLWRVSTGEPARVCAFGSPFLIREVADRCQRS